MIPKHLAEEYLKKRLGAVRLAKTEFISVTPISLMSPAKKRRYFGFLVILVAFVVPAILLLNSPGFVGPDSYYFYNFICNPETPHYNAVSIETLLPTIIFSSLPCNELMLKLVLLALFALTLIAFYLIGEETKKGSGFLTILFAGIVPILTVNSFKLENDAFAFPILFFGLYLFLKHLNQKENKNYYWLLLSVLFLGLGTLLWGGGIYYPLIFGIAEPLFLITAPAIMSYLLLFTNFCCIETGFSEAFELILGPALVSNLNIMENNPFNGILFVLLYVLWWKNFNFPYKKLLIPLGIMGVVNPKFFMLAIPFFALTLVSTIKEMPEKRKNLIAYAIVLSLFFNIAGFGPIDYTHYPPKAYEIQAVQDLVQAGQDFNKPLANDWSFGHMVWFYGGETEFHSGISSKKPGNQENALVLTRYEMETECEVLKQYDNHLFGYHLRLYNCQIPNA